MGRPPKLADESFLPDLSIDKIKEMYKAEKDCRDGQKMLVAYHYKSGKSIKEAAEAACADPETARRWIADMRKRGEAALRHRKAPGPARILTRDQYIRLVRDVHRGPRACGFKTNTWSYALVHKYVLEKFGVDISYRAFVRNMHELRVVVKSPRTSHPCEASPEKRAEFRREARKKVLAAARRGYLVAFLDEAFLQSYKNALRTLGIKGDRTTVPSSVERALLPLFGIVGDGFYYFMEAKRANTAWFIKFSDRVVELFGPVQFILDYASYHLSEGFEKHVKESGCSIIRHFTLKYTPNDNSAEGQWKSVKSALSNVSLRSRKHMSDTLGKAVCAGEVPPVAVFDYARVGTRRLSPSEARAIKAKIGKGEHFWYEETEPPGRIRLPTAEEVRKNREEVLTPEMRERLPRRLAKSGLPEKYLADPPDLLLKR